MGKKLVRISKFLSLVLRHDPETIGISLDESGWVEVDALLARANQAGMPLNKELLRQVVERSNKQRFSFSDDGLKIRANYGHSISVDLGLEPIIPPELLYHGTATRFVEPIRRHGLIPRGRTYVHLSADEHTAMEIGQRHGKPIVLTIQAAHMYEHGFQFYRSTEGIWLTEKVPVEHIVFPTN